MLHGIMVVTRQLFSGTDEDGVLAERGSYLRECPDIIDVSRGARVGEAELREPARSIGGGADSRARRRRGAAARRRLCARPKPERRPVGGEPIEQRTPVAELGVEDRTAAFSRSDGHGELDACPARRILEPGVPDRPRVREHGVEVHGDRDHGHQPSMVSSPPQTGER